MSEIKITKSRRKTIWDKAKEEDLLPEELYLKEVYKDNYDKNHPSITKSFEVDFLNKINMKVCPRCGSINIIKRGFTKNKIQRYYCKTCDKTFTILTNTIFENHKITLDQYVKFLLNIIHYSSISSSSRNNKNSYTTSRYWLQKIFLVLKHFQDDIVLDGEIFLDETYYSINSKDKILIEGKELRGLSRNQYCIGVATNKMNTIAFVEGVGKTSFSRTEKTFYQHIKPGSTLIHDKEKSHKILVDKLNLQSIVYDSQEIAKLSKKDNPLQPINDIHDLLKKFVRSHSGFDRAYLQDYLNLFCLIVNEPKNNLEKVKLTLQLSLKRQLSLKYRDFYLKNEEKHEI